jgi:hypothetical protein
MQKLLTRAIAAAVVLLLAPVSAHASSPWGWLDKLSGPGPFDANGRLFLPIPITTTRPRPGSPRSIFGVGDSLDERRLYVVFETARFTGETNPDFSGAVNISTLQGIVFLHPAGFKNDTKSPIGALDFGAGLGAYRFSGAGVLSDGRPDGAFWRTAIPVRIRLTPSELFARQIKSAKWRNGLAVFSYMIGWDVLPGTFDATDFVVSPKGAGYKSTGNAPFTCGLIIDVTPVFFGR